MNLDHSDKNPGHAMSDRDLSHAMSHAMSNKNPGHDRNGSDK